MLQLVNLARNWDRIVATDGRKVEPLPDVPPVRQWVICKATKARGPLVAAVRRPTANVPRGLERTYLLNEALGEYAAPLSEPMAFSSDLDGMGMALHPGLSLSREGFKAFWDGVV